MSCGEKVEIGGVMIACEKIHRTTVSIWQTVVHEATTVAMRNGSGINVTVRWQTGGTRKPKSKER